MFAAAAADSASAAFRRFVFSPPFSYAAASREVLRRLREATLTRQYFSLFSRFAACFALPAFRRCAAYRTPMTLRRRCRHFRHAACAGAAAMPPKLSPLPLRRRRLR